MWTIREFAENVGRLLLALKCGRSENETVRLWGECLFDNTPIPRRWQWEFKPVWERE